MPLMKYILFCIFTLFTGYLYSQCQLRIIDPLTNKDVTNSQVYFNDAPGAIMSSGFYIYNAGGQSLPVHAFRKKVQDLPGQMNKFCFGPYCYSLLTDSSSAPVNIQSLDTNFSFSFSYFAFDSVSNPLSGLCIMRYTFYEAQNPSSFVYVDVHFNTGTTFAPVNSDKNKIICYPNPAKNTLYISSAPTLFENFKLFNSSGALILDGSIQKETTAIDLSSFAKGIYNLQLHGKSATRTQLIIIE